MLNKRSQIYEIQKKPNGGHRGSNKPDNNKMASVHSNSFNFSSASSATSVLGGSSASNGLRELHNQAVRKTKQPRMGVPMMTSTPRGQTRTSSGSGMSKYRFWIKVGSD